MTNQQKAFARLEARREAQKNGERITPRQARALVQ